MVTKEQATEVALRLAKPAFGYEPNDDTLTILDSHTRETTHGWLMVYNTREYATTGDPLLGLMGNGPIAVPKDGSPPELFPSGVSLDEALAEFEGRFR